MHGTPGSRKGPKPRGIALYRQGIRLISYDRPGYGMSDRREGRDVADAANDVAAVAGFLGLKRFAIVGRSGGGPHALACAAHPAVRSMVTRVAVLVSFAPWDSPDVDWYDGMNEDNVRGFGRDAPDTATVEAEIAWRAKQAGQDPYHLIRHLMEQMPPKDLQTINQYALRRKIVESHGEALRTGPYGWIDDALALRRDWKFDLAAIDTDQIKVLIWHGAHDTFAPVGHAHLLHQAIPGATMQVDPHAAHFDAIEVLPRLLPWLIQGSEPARTGALIGAS
ncbi:alpha/beta fold hydrolase [Dactylosporangium sp. CA-092794]|uniref:alpha/beta fold hydrolase n=1 Tax=Dactylosporangium sp. CA-092794 TaxID=3239929 RepID=UPI003D8C3D8A